MDELLGRRVPQSPQAEQAVIGSMLIDPGCIPDVLKEAMHNSNLHLSRLQPSRHLHPDG